jgi:hypothetical protein
VTKTSAGAHSTRRPVPGSPFYRDRDQPPVWGVTRRPRGRVDALNWGDQTYVGIAASSSASLLNHQICLERAHPGRSRRQPLSPRRATTAASWLPGPQPFPPAVRASRLIADTRSNSGSLVVDLPEQRVPRIAIVAGLEEHATDLGIAPDDRPQILVHHSHIAAETVVGDLRPAVHRSSAVRPQPPCRCLIHCNHRTAAGSSPTRCPPGSRSSPA